MQYLFNRITVYRPHPKPLTYHCSFPSSSDGYTELIEIYSRDRALLSGKALHSRLITNGLAPSTHFASKLIAFYAECRQLSDARKLFDSIPQQNIPRWIVLIGAYSRHGFHREAMSVFREMQGQGLEPNKFVLPSALKACGHLSDRRTGAKIHTVILKYQFESDEFVNSALIGMYSKCGEVAKARRVFDGMVEKDLVSMNTMVLGYVQLGFVKEALDLVEKMRLVGVKPNVVTWNTLIAGFSQANDEVMIAQLFRFMQDAGVKPDVVSWTSIISGFVKNFRNNEAFGSFRKMLDLGLCPSSATISSILPACATVADLTRGKEIHGYAVVIGVGEDIFVCSALIDMYAKCGLIHEAKTLFDHMPERNTVTQNSMIFSYANHGYSIEGIELFIQMVKDGKKPDHITFTAILTACCQGGMIGLGEHLFAFMQEKYGIQPRLEHYACMVDLLGRGGKVIEAYHLIQKMPIEPDLYVWGALLGACRQYGLVDLAEIAVKRLAKLEPESAGSSLLISNLYAEAGKWGNSSRVKRAMKKRKLRMFPGCSWIGAV